LLEQGLQVKKKSKIDFFFSARAPYLSPWPKPLGFRRAPSGQ
jgi:hypothetical protein